MKRSLPEGPVSRQSPPDLPLFRMPDIRTVAPIAPGSDSSREGAKLVTDPIRRRSFRLIFASLAAHGMQSREQLSETTGLKESALCGRLSELSMLWVTVTESAIVAASGCRVNGYELSPAGIRRWQRANEPLVLYGQSLEEQK